MQKPCLVDLTVEEGSRLKVIYGSTQGFHAVDVDSGQVYDIYLPKHVSVLVGSESEKVTWFRLRNQVFGRTFATNFK